MHGLYYKAEQCGQTTLADMKAEKAIGLVEKNASEPIFHGSWVW